ncbi:MAG: glycerol-3-phosphate 1-O-acyltransferase PlsY [Clostridia bacterium]|nr:glycerol-3-phosphate 1-O-acyltransferase PlsY [Clostridia bacterium]
MFLLRLILCALLGYLFGNVQTGLIIGRLTRNIDLREHGSGSSGATNALRVLGRQQALVTLLGDALKGVLAVCAGLIIGGQRGGMIAAIFVTIGHIWPVFFGFHGGKGISTTVGSLLVLMPVHSAIFLIIGSAVIYLTKMVSVGSISGALTLLILTAITSVTGNDWFVLVFGVIISGLVIFAHRGNIARILKGTENKISASMFRDKEKKR